MRGRPPADEPRYEDLTIRRTVKIMVQRNEFGKVIRPQPSIDTVTRLIEELLHQDLGHLIEDYTSLYEP